MEYGVTNMHMKVAYTWASGQRTFVMSSAIPAGAHEGDHFTVLYDPRYVKESRLATFDTFWKIPVYEAVLGVALTSFGVFTRSRRRVVFTAQASHSFDKKGVGLSV